MEAVAESSGEGEEGEQMGDPSSRCRDEVRRYFNFSEVLVFAKIISLVLHFDLRCISQAVLSMMGRSWFMTVQPMSCTTP